LIGVNTDEEKNAGNILLEMFERIIESYGFETASGNQLDEIAKLYGITRNEELMPFGIVVEDDVTFRERIKNGIRTPSTQVSSCNHEWAEYHGLMENYKYCKKCDQKDKS